MARLGRLLTAFGAFALLAACADEPVTRVDAEALREAAARVGPGATSGATASAASCELPASTLSAAAQGLVPEGVFALGHLDAKAIAATPLASLLGATPDSSALASAMRACDVPPASVASIDFGIRSATETVIVVGAPGIGRGTALECLHRQLADDEGASPWSFDAEACPPALHAEDGRVHAYPAGPDRIVVATGGWSTLVAARVRGEGRAALEGSIASVAAQVDRSSSLWAVAQLPESLAPALAGSPLAGMREASLSVDVPAGLNAHAELGFVDSDRARAWSGEASATLEQLAPRIASAGLPTSLARAARVEVDEARVELELELDGAETSALLALAEPGQAARLQALLGGSGPAPVARVVAAAPPPPERTGSPKGDVYAHACLRDDAESCFHLAAMYARGQELAADGTQAVALYQRACRLGHGQACDLVGT